ncbi:MAG: hypothetical protein AAGD33_16200 [Actinomycetota bacterium]
MAIVEQFTAPLFHFSDDLVSFDSVELMLRYVEPWDVSDSDQAFDAAGRRIVLSGRDVKRRRFWVSGGSTVVDLGRSGAPAPDELEGLLRRYIANVGSERLGVELVDLESVLLDRLVATVHPFTRVQ